MRAFALISSALLLTSLFTSARAQTTPVLPTAPQVDYPAAVWVPAAPGNFQPANRPQEQPIDMVVVHDIEGPDTAALDIFQKVGAKVSSHYVVGADGTVYQMVREHDVAWHAGNGDINRRAIGIETHGYAYRPGFYSATIYETEAKLVRDITQRYSIPRDRAHIIGHSEVPNPRDPTRFGGVSGHTDPGPYWDWGAFMALVRNDARLESADIPTEIHPGQKLPAVVTLQNTGDDAWIANKAPDARQGLQADAPVVFLGTSQGTHSAFSDLGGWVSPQYADVLKGADVAPGSSARFDFTLQGPRILGEFNETLRATRVPTVGQGGVPVCFGAPISLKVNVVPWDITIPAPDMSALTQPPVVQSPVARWTVKLPVGGIWGVFVAPPKPAQVRRKDSFSYNMNGTNGQNTFTLGAKDVTGGLVFGDYYRSPEPTSAAPTITVTLDKAPPGITAANAGSLRLIGPFPAQPEQMLMLPGAIGAISTTTQP